MAAGVIYQTVTTTSGETIEQGFWVDDTVSPTTWIPIKVITNSSGAAIGGDATNGLDVDVTRLPALAAGTNAIGKLAANSGVDIGDVDVTSLTPGTGATNLGKAEDAAHSSGDTGVMLLAVRKDTAAALAGTDADYIPLIVDASGRLHINPSGLDYGSGTGGSATQRVIVDSSQLGSLGQAAMTASVPVAIANNQSGLANRVFSVAFATLTRPANTTAYAAGDSISDNGTAGSVTALVSGNISDVNNDPIFISEIHINSTDTGLAGKKLRAYLYNSDPTASSGVSGGDNAAFSNKKAGYIGSFMGWMETGFSDGTVGRLVPCFNETNFTQAGGFIPALPVSGAKTLYIQYQAVEAFTPSANSTTIIGTAKGWQGRAA